MPSPVIPATSPISWDRRTSRLLSVGSALATTRMFLRTPLSCPSSIAAISLLVSTAPWLCVPIRPHSLAMAVAVSLLSPVIITTWTPAPCTDWMAPFASGRISSRMPTSPIRHRFLNSPFWVTGVSDTASASTRTAFWVISFHLRRTGLLSKSGRARPFSS